MKTHLAIDPGASGGLAWGSPLSKYAISPTPDTEGDYVDLLAGIKAGSDFPVIAYVEKVGGFTRETGAARQPGSAMFKFGFGAGVIEGALRALKIETIYVTPQKWQKHFGLGTAASCSSKTVWKNKLKAEAQRRYPDLKVTLATCDALLILSYAIEQSLCNSQNSIPGST